ncbi:MAG: hypothetical protein AAB499_00545 [Patescibacteria group bacterium]
MLAAIRNTFLTGLALVATVYGVGWNQQALRYNGPEKVSQRVRASLTSAIRNQLPLRLTLSDSTIRLGDWQEITVSTSPLAEVELALVYPDGRSDRPPTANGQASANGRWQTKVKLDDWRQLGVFRVLVVARLNNRQSQASASFVLEPLPSDLQPGREKYIYPLVP